MHKTRTKAPSSTRQSRPPQSASSLEPETTPQEIHVQHVQPSGISEEGKRTQDPPGSHGLHKILTGDKKNAHLFEEDTESDAGYGSSHWSPLGQTGTWNHWKEGHAVDLNKSEEHVRTSFASTKGKKENLCGDACF